MKRRMWDFRLMSVGVGVAVCGFMWGDITALPAQAAEIPGVHVASADYLSRSQSSPNNVLDTRVSIDLSGVSLKSALTDLMKRTNVRVSYSPLVVPLDRRVTVRGTNISFGDALKQLLQGTAAKAIVSRSGQVVLVRAAERSEQQDGTIVGKVTSGSQKQPVVGATILLNGESTKVVTGADGTFRLAVPAGTHTLQVRSLGFVRQSRTVTVAESETVTADFVLEASTSVLNEVVVTGTVVETERRAIPTPITVVTSEDIERRGITRIEDLFRGSVPGVVALDVGTRRFMGQNNFLRDTLGSMMASEVFARGKSTAASANEAPSTPLKTYLDGVELLDPSYLGSIDPQSIERIEIITGPQASTIYGSGAIGGVMQIFTKKGLKDGTATEYSLRLQYGILQNSLSSGKSPQHRDALTVTGGGGPQFSYSGTLSYDYTGQWQPGLFNRSYSGSIGATHQRDDLTMSGSVSLTSASNGTLGSLGVRSSPLEKLYKEIGIYTPANNAHFNSERIARSASQTLSLSFDYRVTPSWQHHVVLGRSQSDLALDPESPVFRSGQDTLFRRTESNGKRTTVSYNTTLQSRIDIVSSSLTLGFNGSRSDRIQVTGCMVSQNATTYVPCGSDNFVYAGTIAVSRPTEDKSWGGFGSWQVGFADRLYLTMGLRGERNPNYGREHKVDWTPRVGVAYSFDLSDLTVKLLGSYGRATRPPRPNMRDAVEAVSRFAQCDPCIYIRRFENPGLAPEFSSGPQGGVELYYGNHSSLAINHYRQDIRDLIQQIEVDSILVKWFQPGFGLLEQWVGQWQYANVAAIKQTGWEVTGTSRIGPFTFEGVYSWNDSRVVASYSTAVPLGTFAGVPTHTGYVSVAYALGGTSVLLSSNYIGSSSAGTFSPTSMDYTPAFRLQMYVPRFTMPTTYVRNDGYSKADLRISQHVSKNVSMTVAVQNLMNRFDSDATEGFPSLGRQTLLGVSIRSR